MTEKLDTQTVVSTEPVEPTPEQLETLRHVADKIPTAAWLVALFSSMERFSYFAFSGPLRPFLSLLFELIDSMLTD
jgi:POT family proton-dependent oligopeptide transporter